MSDFNQIKHQYAIYYKFIGIRVRGKLNPIAIFQEYWYGRRALKLYYPYNPKTAEQQAWRGVFYDSVKNWQGFDIPTKQYYNKWAKYKHLSGYNRYLSLYLGANYPPVLDKRLLETGDSRLLETGDYRLLE